MITPVIMAGYQALACGRLVAFYIQSSFLF
jgi:hypothetical protein